MVRLNGGAPFVLGRGGEVALACVRAVVPFGVVPGGTSAVAVPTLAASPSTHRGIAQDFSVVSARLDPSHPGGTVDWQALAGSSGTLVLLMAVAHLERVDSEPSRRTGSVPQRVTWSVPWAPRSASIMTWETKG